MPWQFGSTSRCTSMGRTRCGRASRRFGRLPPRRSMPLLTHAGPSRTAALSLPSPSEGRTLPASSAWPGKGQPHRETLYAKALRRLFPLKGRLDPTLRLCKPAAARGLLAAAKDAPTQPMHGTSQPVYEPSLPMNSLSQPLYVPSLPMHGTLQPMYRPSQPLYGALQPLYSPVLPLHAALQPLYGTSQPLIVATGPLYAGAGTGAPSCFGGVTDSFHRTVKPRRTG
jgi:hypothetical protein